MFRKAIIMLLIGLFAQCIAVKAQVKLDVKTSFDDKGRLTVIKNGIIEVLDSSPLFEVVTFGEDYSLWITDMRRGKFQGKNSISLFIQIHVPALIGKGKKVRSKRIFISYDPQFILGNYNTTELRQRISLLIQGKAIATKLASKDEVATAMLAVEPVSGALIKATLYLIEKYMGGVNLNASRLILAESIYSGHKVEDYLEEVFYGY